MYLTYVEGVFRAYWHFDYKHIPKEAGFRWAPEQKFWYTTSPERAIKLIDYADDRCRDILLRFVRKTQRQNVQMVQRQDWFVLNLSKDDDAIPKAAQFRWYKRTQTWATRNPWVAYRLLEFAAPPCKAWLEQWHHDRVTTLRMSRAQDSDELIPVPEGLEYLPFQRAGVAFARRLPACLLADDMGLGKTIQAIGYLNSLPASALTNVLIVCPASLKLNWKKELQRWLVHKHLDIHVADSQHFPANQAAWLGRGRIIIINYDVLLDKAKKKELEAKKAKGEQVDGKDVKQVIYPRPELVECIWDVMVVDECFPAERQVLTDKGYKPIGTIFAQAAAGDFARVLSCDLRTGKLRWKRVARAMLQERQGCLVRVTHEHGELVCTPNHKLWTEDGWIEAGCVAGKTLRVVRQPLPLQGTRQEGVPGAEILRQPVCSQVADDAAGATGEQHAHYSHGAGSEQGTAETRRDGAHAPAESRPELSSSLRGCDAGAAQAESHFSSTGWERADHGAAETVGEPFGAGDGASRAAGSRDGDVRVLPDQLQGRLGTHRDAHGHRSGRAITRHQAMEVFRSAQGADIISSRVVSVEILESHGADRNGDGGVEDRRVYNLEIEGDHNYFCDGVLVSNCHYVKNEDSQRSQALYAVQAKRRIAMTGTPICNRVREIWPIIHWLDPVNFRLKTEWMERFTGAYYDEESESYDDSGATNLDELQELLRSTIMVRRKKKDVLKELPAKRRQVIEIPAPKGVLEKERASLAVHASELAMFKAKLRMVGGAGETDEEYAEAVAQLGDQKKFDFGGFSQIAIIRHETARAKLPFVIDHLSECIEAEGKVVCFAHHRDIIEGICDAFGDKAVRLYGGMDLDDRDASVTRFQTDDTCKLFVGSIMAAGVGLTLTAASHVVFAELDWVPGNVTQAEDRCHRIGQRDSVTVQHLVLEESLDAHIAATLVRKQDIIDRALDRQEVRST